MIQLTKIIPTEKNFLLSWIPHIRCNYDCMYCPESRHNDHSVMPTFEQMCVQWQQIFEKTKHRQLPYKISFSGGETTINKDFVPFVKWINVNYGDYVRQVIVTTNGSASLAYYIKLFETVTSISFSTHTEYMTDDFLSKVKSVNDHAGKNNKFVFVNIMQEYWATEQVKIIIEFCQQNNIAYGISKIVHGLAGSRQWPIFKQHKQSQERKDLAVNDELIRASNQEIDPLITLDDKYYNVELSDLDGNSHLTFASKIRFMDMHHFQGWACHAGLDRIFVLPDSSVYSGECENDFLGNLNDNSFQLFNGAQICKRKTCTNNPDDLQVTKYAI